MSAVAGKLAGSMRLKWAASLQQCPVYAAESSPLELRGHVGDSTPEFDIVHNHERAGLGCYFCLATLAGDSCLAFSSSQAH